MSAILVLYATHEIGFPLRYFISKGLYPEIDYVFVINNKSLTGKVEGLISSKASIGADSISDSNNTSRVNTRDNIRVLYRENRGYDFAAWDYALNKIDIGKYRYFIFVNSSVIGPILPVYFTGRWTDVFINFLSQDTLLVGSTINLEISPHVQSYVLCTNTEGLKIIRPYIRSYYFKGLTVRKGEIGLSKAIIDKGYKIFSLLEGETRINPVLTQYNPTEVIFIKGFIASRRGLLEQLASSIQSTSMPATSTPATSTPATNTPVTSALATSALATSVRAMRSTSTNASFVEGSLQRAPPEASTKASAKTLDRVKSIRIFYIFSIISFNLIYFLACNRNLDNCIYLITSTLMPRKNILGYAIIYRSDPVDFVFSQNSEKIIIKDETLGPIVPRWLRLKYNWLAILIEYISIFSASETNRVLETYNNDHRDYGDIFDGSIIYCRGNLYKQLSKIKNILPLGIFRRSIESLRML
jgi:hypothetical protein